MRKVDVNLTMRVMSTILTVEYPSSSSLLKNFMPKSEIDLLSSTHLIEQIMIEGMNLETFGGPLNPNKREIDVVTIV
jgi:hypothetical protein